jgi:hypothetical protein
MLSVFIFEIFQCHFQLLPLFTVKLGVVVTLCAPNGTAVAFCHTLTHSLFLINLPPFHSSYVTSVVVMETLNNLSVSLLHHISIGLWVCVDLTAAAVFLFLLKIKVGSKLIN